MDYKMEDLIPIVGKLAERYTSFESTSVTYEKAEQFMKAVLYCIQEAEAYGHGRIVPINGLSAEQAYETGLALVEQKVKQTLKLYNRLMEDFKDYDNLCLHDTVVNGLPEFFRWYDTKYEPQNTILMLDYPVLKDLSRYSGVDKIYEYICCVRLEQKFLRMFPESWVTQVLLKNNPEYEDMIENICEVVLVSVFCHMMAGKSLLEDFSGEDYIRLQKMFDGMETDALRERLRNALEHFMKKLPEDTDGLGVYLDGVSGEIAVRLKYAARCGGLQYFLSLSGET